jgi:hypothetical protein
MRIKRKKKPSILVEMQKQVPESKHAKETKEKGLYPPAYPNPILFVQHLQSKRQAKASQPAMGASNNDNCAPCRIAHSRFAGCRRNPIFEEQDETP